MYVWCTLGVHCRSRTLSGINSTWGTSSVSEVDSCVCLSFSHTTASMYDHTSSVWGEGGVGGRSRAMLCAQTDMPQQTKQRYCLWVGASLTAIPAAAGCASPTVALSMLQAASRPVKPSQAVCQCLCNQLWQQLAAAALHTPLPAPTQDSGACVRLLHPCWGHQGCSSSTVAH